MAIVGYQQQTEHILIGNIHWNDLELNDTHAYTSPSIECRGREPNVLRCWKRRHTDPKLIRSAVRYNTLLCYCVCACMNAMNASVWVRRRPSEYTQLERHANEISLLSTVVDNGTIFNMTGFNSPHRSILLL